MQLLAVTSIHPQVAAPEVTGIMTMQVTAPSGFPAILANRLPVEVTVHPSRLAGGGSLGGHGTGPHNQQGRHKGKQ